MVGSFNQHQEKWQSERNHKRAAEERSLVNAGCDSNSVVSETPSHKLRKSHFSNFGVAALHAASSTVGIMLFYDEVGAPNPDSSFMKKRLVAGVVQNSSYEGVAIDQGMLIDLLDTEHRLRGLYALQRARIELDVQKPELVVPAWEEWLREFIDVQSYLKTSQPVVRKKDIEDSILLAVVAFTARGEEVEEAHYVT